MTLFLSSAVRVRPYALVEHQLPECGSLLGLLQLQIAKSYFITDRGWEMHLEPARPHPLLARILMFIPFFQQMH